MKFWIDDEEGETFEQFSIPDNEDSTQVLHFAGMHEADAMGYSDYEGFFLITEDGHTYPVVDPYKSEFWQTFEK